MKGVIELGTTDLVNFRFSHWFFNINTTILLLPPPFLVIMLLTSSPLCLKVLEDLSLIQQIKTSFLNILNVDDPSNTETIPNTRNNEGVACEAFDHNDFNVELIPEVEYDIINNTTTSPNGSSNALDINQLLDETFMVESINHRTSQVQSWQVIDDDLSNCVHNNSMNSSDCISQTFASPQKINASADPKGGEDCNNQKMTLVDPLTDDWHYQGILSTLLKSADQLIMGVHFQNFHQESSFCVWNKGGTVDCHRPRQGTSQKLLKKILFEVPRMHMDGLLESQEENDYREGTRLEADEGMNHVMSERRRRAKLNERFLTLRSMVPSNSKVIYLYFSPVNRQISPQSCKHRSNIPPFF